MVQLVGRYVSVALAMSLKILIKILEIIDNSQDFCKRIQFGYRRYEYRLVVIYPISAILKV